MTRPLEEKEIDTDRTDPEISKPTQLIPRIFGDSPIQEFMDDASITEIMVNDYRNVVLEKEGKLVPSGFRFKKANDLNQFISTVLEQTGRTMSPDQPLIDVMLADGSRMNIVLPPLTVNGPSLTIRKFPKKRFTIDDLMSLEMLDQRIAYFLNICVLGKVNILISGGTGSGKTTLLNVLSGFVPGSERMITIEDTPELVISNPNGVRMQTKPAEPSSTPVTARDLVANALRMRPDRIIVGECRRGEAFDMLQAMNTGHTGSMTTLHANAPRDALSRLETLCMMSGVELPLIAIRKQISSAIDLIVQVHRSKDGKRRIMSISELTGMEGDTFTLQDLFYFQADTKGRSGGKNGFKAAGYVPTFVERLKEQGFEFPPNYFG